jgi:hypothetical protein
MCHCREYPSPPMSFQSVLVALRDLPPGEEEISALLQEFYDDSGVWQKHCEETRQWCEITMEKKSEGHSDIQRIHQKVHGRCGEVMLQIILQHGNDALETKIGMSVMNHAEREDVFLSRRFRLRFLSGFNVLLSTDYDRPARQDVEYDACLIDNAGTKILFLDACTSPRKVEQKIDDFDRMARVTSGFDALKESNIEAAECHVLLPHGMRMENKEYHAPAQVCVVSWFIREAILDLTGRTMQSLNIPSTPPRSEVLREKERRPV